MKQADVLVLAAALEVLSAMPSMATDPRQNVPDGQPRYTDAVQPKSYKHHGAEGNSRDAARTNQKPDKSAGDTPQAQEKDPADRGAVGGLNEWDGADRQGDDAR